MPFLNVASRRIEFEQFAAEGAGAPTLVFLHEGLGSIAMWRDFPDRVARTAGCGTLVYSRYGYGRSDPLAGPRTVRYMHDEAQIALPDLLDQLGVERPILIGHSDGGSIALIHAGAGLREVAGVVTLAAHLFVEDVSVASIAAARIAYESTDLRARLARFHSDVDSAFWGWNRIWLDPAFRTWNIEGYVSRIACPVLAIQGVDDEYGTMEQIDRIARLAPDVTLLKLDGCGHSPHREEPDAVIDAVARFVDRVRYRGSATRLPR